MSQELSIINSCLRITGEGPQSSVDSKHPDVAVIRSVISEVKRTALSNKGRGLWCNTDKDFPLTRNVNNEIPVPNALSVDVHDSSIVVRGGKLYNKYEHTFKFTDDVCADIQYDLDLDDLPQVVIELIRSMARKLYLGDDDGDLEKWQTVQAEVAENTIIVQTEDRRQKNINRVTNPRFYTIRSRTKGYYSGVSSGDYVGGRPYR